MTGKGSRGERWVVNRVEDELGFYAQRTGASGGATSRNRPDIIASGVVDGEVMLLFIELKCRSTPTQRFSKEEVRDLEEAAERAGAVPYVMSKPDLRKYSQPHLFQPSDLKENAESYSIVQKMLPGETLESIFTGN